MLIVLLNGLSHTVLLPRSPYLVMLNRILSWRDSGGQLRLQTLLPVDLVTQQGAEYLLAADVEHGLDKNHLLRLRLDYIISAVTL